MQTSGIWTAPEAEEAFWGSPAIPYVTTVKHLPPEKSDGRYLVAALSDFAAFSIDNLSSSYHRRALSSKKETKKQKTKIINGGYFDV